MLPSLSTTWSREWWSRGLLRFRCALLSTQARNTAYPRLNVQRIKQIGFVLGRTIHKLALVVREFSIKYIGICQYLSIEVCMWYRLLRRVLRRHSIDRALAGHGRSTVGHNQGPTTSSSLVDACTVHQSHITCIYIVHAFNHMELGCLWYILQYSQGQAQLTSPKEQYSGEYVNHSTSGDSMPGFDT